MEDTKTLAACALYIMAGESRHPISFISSTATSTITALSFIWRQLVQPVLTADDSSTSSKRSQCLFIWSYTIWYLLNAYCIVINYIVFSTWWIHPLLSVYVIMYVLTLLRYILSKSLLDSNSTNISILSNYERQ
jgi:hypothetical protein